MSRFAKTIFVTFPLPLALACGTASEPDDGLSLMDTEAYMEQEVLVSIDDGQDGVARMLISDRFEIEELEHSPELGVSRFWIDGDRTVKDLRDALEQDHRVRFAEPNYMARASGQTPDDPYYAYQWNLEQVRVEKAWEYGDGSGITVAVLDTGVRDGGPDGLATLLDGHDFYYGDSDPTDNDGHGTFVANTIGQATDNGVGVAGMAPGARILPVKVLSDQGYGDISAIANGVVYATQQGADVINMSLGSYSPSRTLQEACDYAYDSGVVVVAATGNEFAGRVNYPGAYDSVIAVGASRVDGTRSGYSNTGTGIDLIAPGGDVSADQNGDGYADGVLQETYERGWTYTFWEGTSMATPHVAAAAALVLEQGHYTPDQVLDILAESAVDVGSPGYDTMNGWGRLDAGAAVVLAAGGSGSTPDTGDEWVDEGDDSGSDQGPDTAAPNISNVSGYTQGNSFTIEWVTDEPATSNVDFNDYGEFGNGELTTAHTLRFNGQPGSTYKFTIVSRDAAGNEARDGTWRISL